MFPISGPVNPMEAVMLEHGDDAGHCSNGLSAQNYRGATAEERAIYRKWIRGTIAFYSTLVLIFGIVAIVNYSGTSLTKLTNHLGYPTAASLRTN
jgi:hypothetical protein